MTLTIPLVSENYPFDGLLSSDATGTIQVSAFTYNLSIIAPL